VPLDYQWLTALSIGQSGTMINVTDPAAVGLHSLLQNAPDRSRRSRETVDQSVLGNSAIIFLTPYPFSAPSRLITIVQYLFDTILLICLSAHLRKRVRV